MAVLRTKILTARFAKKSREGREGRRGSVSFDSVRLSFDSVRFSPLMSVLIVSLYVRGGTSRTAALLLLAISAIGLVMGFVKKSSARPQR